MSRSDEAISAYGKARSTVTGTPLGAAELRDIDAYWRASLYLCLGMLHLKGQSADARASATYGSDAAAVGPARVSSLATGLSRNTRQKSGKRSPARYYRRSGQNGTVTNSLRHRSPSIGGAGSAAGTSGSSLQLRPRSRRVGLSDPSSRATEIAP